MKPIFRSIGKLIPVYWQGTEPGEAVPQWHGAPLYKAKKSKAARRWPGPSINRRAPTPHCSKGLVRCVSAFALPSQLRISAAAVVANQPAVKELQ